MNKNLLPGEGHSFDAAVAELPPLPAIIEYEDEYDEVVRSIRTRECWNEVAIHVSGESTIFRFNQIDSSVRELVRHYLLSNLQVVAPGTMINYYRGIFAVQASDIKLVSCASPLEVKEAWPTLSAKYPIQMMAALKSLLGFLCKCRFMSWSSLYADFVSYSLSLQGKDPYASVRSGSCFLTIEQEAKLVRWIDSAAQGSSALDRREVEIACLIVCSYQFGMRPKQLGMIRNRDCSVRQSTEDGTSIVHLTFRMIKQRDEQLSGLPLVRKVKREWAPLFSCLVQLKKGEPKDAFLFGFKSRAELSSSLIKQLDEILPGGGVTAYDLRHTMAQRLVDSGASQEELAAALGHSALRTGLVYFGASANQAELVNKALGASPVYQTIAKIARDKFIDPLQLAQLTGAQQVAGVPHGIPVAGIGGCTTGQPSCPSNPVTSCYGCPKFMPVHDPQVHQQVLDDFRSVVVQFRDVGYGDMASPAYLQLQRTIAEVQAVIQELETHDA